jgi:predicted ATPase
MRSLESLIIHQFRGLRDLKLENLGLINLLVGINNSGKTSVLEALEIYCHPLDLRVWFTTARQRERESRIPETPPLDAIRWLFTSNDTLSGEKLQKNTILISSSGSFEVTSLKATYEEIEGIWLSGQRNRQTYSDKYSHNLLIENEDNPESRKGIDLKIKIYTKFGQLNFFEETPNYTKNFQFWKDESLSRLTGQKEPALQTAVVTPSSHRSDIGQFRLLSGATFQDFKSDVLKLLHQMDSDISDLEILLSPESTQFNIYIKHEKLGLAPISIFGDGVRRLLHIALKLASVEGGILLIDELESTIHTEALQNSFRWLVKWCAEMNVQLFATTHSLEAVDALLEVTESEMDLVLYRLEPKELETRVVRHDWKRLKRLREELGQEVRW